VGKTLEFVGEEAVHDFIEELVEGLDGFQHFGDLGIHVLLNAHFDVC